MHTNLSDIINWWFLIARNGNSIAVSGIWHWLETIVRVGGKYWRCRSHIGRNFVDPTIHNQNIERYWRKAKENLKFKNGVEGKSTGIPGWVSMARSEQRKKRVRGFIRDNGWRACMIDFWYCDITF